jgi:phosphatidylglycerophosphate synthase
VKKKPFFADYSTSLKDPCAEEIIDLFLYRPLAYLFVKIFLPLPVTPNQVSFLAMASGVAAGFCLAGGSPRSFMLGGILYGLSNIFDCCDGMLARIKKNGTATGRIVDGVIDYINGAAVFTGLGIGLSSAVHQGTLYLIGSPWLLVAAAAASTALHAILSDYYRNAYLDRQQGPSGGIEAEIEKFSAELTHLTGRKRLDPDTLLIRLYLGYLNLQAGHARRRNPASSSALAPISPKTVILWNLIGPSTHISFFILAAVLYRPEIFFFYVVVIANLWTAALLAARMFKTVRRQI